MSCFGHTTFLKHVVTNIDKNLKLLLSGEGVCPLTLFHDVEHLLFVGDHGTFVWYVTNIGYGGGLAEKCVPLLQLSPISTRYGGDGVLWKLPAASNFWKIVHFIDI